MITPDAEASHGKQVAVCPHLQATTKFLAEIGLPWRWEARSAGFMPGIEIRDGTLLIDPAALPSNVLHEAGHLATLPGVFRPLAQGNISGVQKHMMRVIDFDADPDGELQRAAMQCSDPEATAWAWAAGEHLGLPPEVIIRDDEYGGDGAVIRMHLQHRQYIGINGLSHAGFCAVRPGAYAAARDLPAYPKLKRWLQKDFRTATSTMTL